MDEARNLLPWWVVWGPVLFTLPATFLFSLLLTGLATAIALWPLRKSQSVSWIERARRSFPVRWVGNVSTPLVSLFAFGAALVGLGPLCPVPKPVLVIAVVLAAFIPSALIAGIVVRRLRPGVTWAMWGREVFVGWVLILSPLIVALGMLVLLPWEFTPTYWPMVAIGWMLMLFFALSGGVFLGRAIGVFRPAEARLSAIVERATARAGMRPVITYQADIAQANAVAFIWLRRIAFTDMCLRNMNDDELEAIAAHELAHLREHWIARVARLLPVLAFMPLTIAPALFTQMESLWAVFMVVMPFLVMLFVNNYLSRLLEKHADAAAQHESDAGVYARALLRLSELNVAPLVGPGRGTTHPHMYDRLVAAGYQPEFPRPAAPPRLIRALALGIGVMLPILAAMIWLVVVVFAKSEESAMLCVAAMHGGGEVPMDTLGTMYAARGDYTAAVTLFRAAVEMVPKSVHSRMNLTIALARLGRCDEADAEARKLEHLAAGHERYQQQVLLAKRAVQACR